MLATNEVLNHKSCGCRGGIPESSQLSEVPQDACPLCKRVLRFGMDRGDSVGVWRCLCRGWFHFSQAETLKVQEDWFLLAKDKTTVASL